MSQNTSYVGAPYNFIELNKKVYLTREMQSHDEIDAEKHTGEIEYEIEAKSPIIIDDGNGKFYKNIYGKAAIPGSTMRGLVRSNMQILSFSSVADDIQDGRFMFREVASGKDKKKYNGILGNKTVSTGKKDKDGNDITMSVLQNVKAGYIRKDGNRYCIFPTVLEFLNKEKGKVNYYVVSEKKIIEDRIKNKKNQCFSFLLDAEPYTMQNQLKSFHMRKDKNNRVHYQGVENEQYHPYYKKISYELSGDKKIIAIDDLAKYKYKGCLVSTGFMKEKKAIYVIPEIDEKGDKILIPQSDVDDFKRDYESRKNQVEAMDKDYFNLPKDGETKPVFYIQLNGKLYFGFTPRLRLFYDNNIHKGLCDSQKNAKTDYCRSLFGYSNTDKSYKSRVSFSDAELTENLGEDGEKKLILSSPKPTSYMDYLTSADDKNNKQVASYNDDFELRGVKQYWLKNSTTKGENGDNDNVASRFTPYKTGAKFMGKIRFENLSDRELGMLLWSLLLEKNSQQNIGKAKPYGYGRIAVQLKGLNLLNYEDMYSNEHLSLSPYLELGDIQEKAEQYIHVAKQDMQQFLGKDVMDYPRIRHFLMMKNSDMVPDNEKTRYMSLDKDKKEYQNRKRDCEMLPTVEEVLNGKKASTQNTNQYSGEKNNNSNSNGKNNKGKGGKKISGKNKKTVYSDGDSFTNNAFANIDFSRLKK